MPPAAISPTAVITSDAVLPLILMDAVMAISTPDLAPAADPVSFSLYANLPKPSVAPAAQPAKESARLWPSDAPSATVPLHAGETTPEGPHRKGHPRKATPEEPHPKATPEGRHPKGHTRRGHF